MPSTCNSPSVVLPAKTLVPTQSAPRCVMNTAQMAASVQQVNPHIDTCHVHVLDIMKTEWSDKHVWELTYVPIVKVFFSSLIKGRYLMISPRLAVFLRRTVPAHIMEMFILQGKDTQRNANLGNHSYNIFLTWNNNILITFSCVLYKKRA